MLTMEAPRVTWSSYENGRRERWVGWRDGWAGDWRREAGRETLRKEQLRFYALAPGPDGLPYAAWRAEGERGVVMFCMLLRDAASGRLFRGLNHQLAISSWQTWLYRFEGLFTGPPS